MVLELKTVEKEEDYQETNDVFHMFLLFLRHPLPARAEAETGGWLTPSVAPGCAFRWYSKAGHGDCPRSRPGWLQFVARRNLFPGPPG